MLQNCQSVVIVNVKVTEDRGVEVATGKYAGVVILVDLNINNVTTK